MSDFPPAEQLEALGLRLHPEALPGRPWAAAVRERRYDEALAAIEQRLVEDPRDPETKLWWAYCQLRSGALPPTALTAPLDEIAPALEERPQLHRPGCATFTALAAALLKKSQPRLAVHMLTRVRALDTALDAEERSAFYEAFGSLLDEECERAPLRREAKPYLELLEKNHAQVEQSRRSFAIPAATGEKRRAAGSFTSRDILEAAATAETPAEDAPFDAPKARLEKGSSRTTMLLLGALAFCLVAAVVLLAFVFVFSTPQDKAFSERLAIELSSPAPQSPLLPAAEPLQVASRQVEPTNLDKVGERLKQLGVPPTADPAAPSQEVDQDALDPKNVRSLPAPTEDQLESLSELPDAGNDIKQNNVPLLDPGRSSKTPGGYSDIQIEDVGTSPRRAPVRPDSADPTYSDPEGRTYGQPRDTDPARNPGNRGLDGQPITSESVEVFNPPLLYHTIAPTEVLAAPSLLAQSLARLEPNTPVHVTRRMGRWLELRSTGGRVGYIYAQDANRR
ncbi:MAG: hypothetical protein KDD69_14775 [Bdellovibrionales bacterium]|nr:hypothetical protein [Bdellovibrionales bacterium]